MLCGGKACSECGFRFNVLCSDEIAAIVADIGTLNSRFGSAGQDSPRHIFRTVSSSL
jgi:hypothetical protein